MIIFKDVFTDDELFSESFKHKLIDNLYYEVEGKLVTRSDEVDSSLLGANPSAEEGDEGCEAAQESGIDIVLNHKLMKQENYNKKLYMAYIKKYMKKLADHVSKTQGEQQAKDLKVKLNELFTKKIIPNINNYDFYSGGENFGDEEGMLALLDWREDGITPFFIFFKDGVVAEKY